MAERHVIGQTTAYLDGALDAGARQGFEAHVAGCPMCSEYLRELREAVRIGGDRPAEPLDPQALSRLRGAFRAWRDERRQP